MEFKTADLCDKYEDKVKPVQSIFRNYGMKKCFGGEIVTVKVFEDNVLVKKRLGENGKGKVLVVDGGGSLRCALMGDMLAQTAIDNHWEGVIIYGCIRDSADIDKMEIGIKALNAIPFKSKKEGVGEENIEVNFADASFKPGEYVYADKDGIITAPVPLLLHS